MENKDQNIEIGSLWINESKAGKKYMSGSIKTGIVADWAAANQSNNMKIVIFSNTNKDRQSTDENEKKKPDYRILVSKDFKNETNQ